MISCLRGQESTNVFEDYFTIINLNGEYKLNINSYIGEKEINIKKETNDISFDIISQKKYMDYEIYKIRVQNNTINTISLDGFRNINSIYLSNENKTKSIAAKQEIIEENLVLISNSSTEIEIKFYKKYSTEIETSSINFSDIILKYNKDNYQDILSIAIDI